jgi:uncharacterized protein YndB with AHSA1/START domain
MSKDPQSKGEVISEHALRFVRVLPHAPEKVWAILTEAARLPEWYGEGGIEPREGGKVVFKDGHIRGVVTGWRPEKFLAYTWNVFSPGEALSRFPVSYVEFALEPSGSGTNLTLTHRPIPEAMLNLSSMGWHTYFDLIEAGLDGEFPTAASLFSKNAALYGVDMSKIKG